MEKNQTFFTGAQKYKQSIKSDFNDSISKMKSFLSNDFYNPYCDADDHLEDTTNVIIFPFTFLKHISQFIYALPVALETLFKDIKSMPEAFKAMGYLILSIGLDLLKIIPSIVSLIVKTINTMIFGYNEDNQYITDCINDELEELQNSKKGKFSNKFEQKNTASMLCMDNTAYNINTPYCSQLQATPTHPLQFFQSEDESLMKEEIAYYKKQINSNITNLKDDISSLSPTLNTYNAHLKKKSDLEDSLKTARHLSVTASKIGGYKQECHPVSVFAPLHPMKFIQQKEMKNVPYYVADENLRAQWAVEASSLSKQLHAEQEKYQSPPNAHGFKKQIESLVYQLEQLHLQLETQPTQLREIISSYEHIMQSMESIKLNREDSYKIIPH